MSRNIGYIVVEYNQASGQPGVPFGADVHFHREDADDDKQQYERGTAASGRRERYEVASLMVPEEGDDD